MNATAIVNLIATLISALAPVITGLVAGNLTPEQARAEALVAVDALLSDLGGLRTRLAADDAAVIKEVVDNALAHSVEHAP